MQRKIGGLLALLGMLAIVTGASLIVSGGVSRAAGGDFSLDLVGAEPSTYVHQGAGEGSETGPGSLQFDARNVGTYVVESLEGDDYNCEDRIVFFTEVSVSSGATGTQAITIDYRFDAEPTGQPAVGYSDILEVGISGPAPIGDFGGQTQETGNQNLDGNEFAWLVSESLDPPGSTVGVDTQSVLGTVMVGGLEGGDVAIVRVDVRFTCFPQSSDPTGSLHAAITSSETTLGDQVNVGQQDIPMLGLGGVGFSTPTPPPTPTSTPLAPGAPTPTSPPGATPPATPTATPPAAAPPGSQPGLPPTGAGGPGTGLSTSGLGVVLLLLGLLLTGASAGLRRHRR